MFLLKGLILRWLDLLFLYVLIVYHVRSIKTRGRRGKINVLATPVNRVRKNKVVQISVVKSLFLPVPNKFYEQYFHLWVLYHLKVYLNCPSYKCFKKLLIYDYDYLHERNLVFVTMDYYGVSIISINLTMYLKVYNDISQQKAESKTTLRYVWVMFKYKVCKGL